MARSHVSLPGPREFPAEPGPEGRFGQFGGRFVPEALIPALEELTGAFLAAREDEVFQAELRDLLGNYAGRPTPLYEAKQLGEQRGGVRIFLKREDLTHTGAHKINNSLGQVLLAKRMGKTRIIAETGAGQHGVATATAAALMGLECAVFMGTLDMERQALNVTRMRMLGASVEPVEAGSRSLKDAVNQAIRDWVTNVRTTHYIIGSAIGPHPYPLMVRHFQKVIGEEARVQMLDQAGGLPDKVVACVGAGSNAIGLFHGFMEDDAELIGVEAAGLGMETGKHSASLCAGTPGILHGAHLKLLQDEQGQVLEAHSVAAGLDYPGVGPEHCHLQELQKARYVAVTDDEAVDAFMNCCRVEGITPALESAHALAYIKKLAPDCRPGEKILVCLSGRGDKDVAQVQAYVEKRL